METLVDRDISDKQKFSCFDRRWRKRLRSQICLATDDLGNYRNDYKDAENVNDKRAVNTTFVMAQNATAARAAGYGDADYSLI